MFSTQLLWPVSFRGFIVSPIECDSTPISIPIDDFQVIPGIEGPAHVGSSAHGMLLLPWPTSVCILICN